MWWVFQEVKSKYFQREESQVNTSEDDPIPEAMKKLQQQLSREEPSSTFAYYYFVDQEDINTHFYIEDADMEILKAEKVVHPVALYIYDSMRMKNSDKAMIDSYDQTTKQRTVYIFPNEDTIDYSSLKIALTKQTLPKFKHPPALSEVYALEEIDSLPSPIRGWEYFQQVILQEIKKNEVFDFYQLKGEVIVEFTVGSGSASPKIVKGFSTKSNKYEAYKADGAFLKAINRTKIRWKPAILDGKPVPVRMKTSFNIQ